MIGPFMTAAAHWSLGVTFTEEGLVQLTALQDLQLELASLDSIELCSMVLGRLKRLSFLIHNFINASELVLLLRMIPQVMELSLDVYVYTDHHPDTEAFDASRIDLPALRSLRLRCDTSVALEAIASELYAPNLSSLHFDRTRTKFGQLRGNFPNLREVEWIEADFSRYDNLVTLCRSLGASVRVVRFERCTFDSLLPGALLEQHELHG